MCGSPNISPIGRRAQNCWPRPGANSEARRAYEIAVGLERDSAVRRFLQRRQSALPTDLDAKLVQGNSHNSVLWNLTNSYAPFVLLVSEAGRTK